MNFYKFQKILSIIPYYSTIFICLVSMYKLTACKATQESWQRFMFLFFVPNICIFIINDLFLNRLGTTIAMIIGGILLIPVNFALVSLQEKVDSTGK